MDIVIYKKQILKKLLLLAEKKEQEIGKKSKDTQERANEEEGAMQSRYSTFKEEGQYLAGGLKRIQQDFKVAVSTIKSLLMHEHIHKNSRVETFSIVEIGFEDGDTNKFFILPALGGEKIDDLMVINPSTPIAKSILSKEAGDIFALRIGNKTRKGEILDVQ
jgi:transcription elongation GreA/GreB family factor